MFAGIASWSAGRSSRRAMTRCCCPGCCCCYCRCNGFPNNGRSADRHRNGSLTCSDEYTDGSELGFASRRDNKLLPTKNKEILMRVGWNRTDSGGYECFLEYKEPSAMGCVEFAATAGSILLLVLTLPFSLFWCFKVVQEYERAVIFRLGRLRTGGARGPGIFFVLPCVDSYCKVDLRTVSFDVPPQEALTKDSVTVTVDAVVYYRIQDPLNAVVKVTNYSNSTRLLAMTTLRNILGTRNLAEILSDREAISHAMQASLDVATDPWGVKVERVEIKDVSLPQQLQRAMAAEAEASREARAKVIAAEGEMKASRALKEASDVINESPAALQLRYLQTLSNISAEKNSTIIFPLPLDLLTPFLKNGTQVI